MLRSIRIPILASLVALAFAACGGGNDPPDNQHDAGDGDGPHIQFDGPKPDGGTPQQDSGTGDGGGGACVASGGGAVSDICKNSKPCTCPLDCANPYGTGYAGACFPMPDPTTGACTGTDVSVKFTDEVNGHCYPLAAIAGNFSVPIAADSSGVGGTANVTINLNGVNAAFTEGWAKHDTTNAWWMIVLYPAGITGYPYAVLTTYIPDAQYVTGTAVDLSAGDAAALFYNYTATAIYMLGQPYEGTITLTEAPTTTGNVTGSFGANSSLFGVKEEMCGPNTEPCG